MKKLTHSLGAKIAAVILFLIFTASTLAGIFGIVYMAEDGYYNPGGHSFYDTGLCAGTTSGYANTVYFNYLPYTLKDNPSEEDLFNLEQYAEQFSKENTNFFFTITASDGTVLLSNFLEQDYGMQRSYSFEAYDDIGSYTINCYVKNPITANDDYARPYEIFSTLYAMRYTIIVITAILAIMVLLLFIFLMSSAGHRKGKDEIVLNALDRIPFDLCVAGIFLLLMIAVNYNNSYIAFASFIIMLLAILALFISFAARFKAGRWWQNTVVYRILKLLWRAVRFTAKSIGLIVGNLPLLWKTVVCFGAYLLINCILVIMLFGPTDIFAFVFGLLFNLAALIGLSYITLQLKNIKQGGIQIAGGDYDHKIDTKNMFWDIKAHAETLNNIGAGMSKAVDARLKSERFKTELITNVSHDIKTPLTSIINYVDLLKKEKIDNENAVEYIGVLDRQSARLKKLTEDLVEASKASTGNLAVSPVSTNIVELLNQSMGEYAERFAENNLETVLHVPEKEPAILADGRLLWRVLDNLLCNICKYSMPHTRVYLDVENTGSMVTVALKNISRYPLNISSDELLERFVRGDSARTTEGSGLGLSIAKSLTELQGGHFNLAIDGDLFKAIITFDSIG